MLAGASRGSAPNSEGGRVTAGEGRLRWNMVRKNASNHTLAPRTVLSSPRIVVDADSPPAATGPHPSTDWWITTARPPRRAGQAEEDELAKEADREAGNSRHHEQVIRR